MLIKKKVEMKRVIRGQNARLAMFTIDREEYFKELLMKNLQELLGKANIDFMGFSELEDRHFDFCDLALVESNAQVSLHITERQSRLIKKIKYTLEKLMKGEFGICEECGEEISEERLMARPVASLCIDCKRAEEKAERSRRWQTSI
jgi:DnaK suppressor protein